MQNRLFIGYKNREADMHICSGVRHANPHIEGSIILFGHPRLVCLIVYIRLIRCLIEVKNLITADAFTGNFQLSQTIIITWCKIVTRTYQGFIFPWSIIESP
jgi:hypothetical protein